MWRAKDFLRQSDFESYKNLGPNDGEAIKKALASLYRHLDDYYLKVGEQAYDSFGSAHLRVFELSDERREQLYLWVNSSGKMCLGRVADLSKPIDQQVRVEVKLEDHGFDPLWDQIVSVNVKENNDPTESHLDVWLVVHKLTKGDESDPSHFEEADVLYRGIAGLDAEGLFLMPYSVRGNTSQWVSRPMRDDQAPWLRRWGYVCDQGQDLFSSVGPDLLAVIETEDKWCHGNLEKLIHHGRDLMVLEGDRIVFIDAEQSVRRFEPIEMHTNLENGCLWREKESTHVAVCCEDRNLVIFTSAGSEGDRDSRFQPCSEIPMAVVSLPGKPALGRDRDLLVTLLDGRLIHLRYIPNQEINKVWNQLWQRSGLTALADKLALAQRTLGKPGSSDSKDYRRAVLINLMKAVVDHEDVLFHHYPTEEMRRSLRKDVKKLFHPSELDAVMLEGVRELTRALSLKLRDKTRLYKLPLEPMTRFLLDLAHDIYLACSMAVQDKFDKLFRTLHIKTEKLYGKPEIIEQQPGDHDSLLYLIRWCKQNRYAVLERGPTNAKDCNDQMYDGMVRVEAWADAFWEWDQLRLREVRKSAHVDITSIYLTGCPQLVVAKRTALVLFPFALEKMELDRKKKENLVTRLDMIQLEPRTFPFASKMSDGIQCLASFPGKDDRLLIGGSSGKLYLLKGQTTDSEPLFEYREVPLKAEDIHGIPKTIACCATAEGDTLFAVAYNQGRRAFLVRFLVKTGQLTTEKLQVSPMRVPRVRFLALSRKHERADEFHLIKGGVVGGAARFVALDEDLELHNRAWAHELRSGTRALCFDRPVEPGYAAIAEREGFLWCCKVTDAPTLADFRWCYRFKKGIRAAYPVIHRSKSHFLVGTESGELTLLSAEEGKRIWKHQYGRPIEKITPLGDKIAVIMQGGWIALMQQNKDVGSFDKLEERLEALKGLLVGDKKSPDDYKALTWRNAENSVQALYALVIAEKPILEIFEGCRERRTRSRLVRFLQERCLPLTPELLKLFSYRELGLALAYEKEPDAERQDAIWKELKRRLPDSKAPKKGDQSVRAAMVPAVAYLQQFARREPGLNQLLQLKLPEQLLATKWVRVVYARVSIEAVERDYRLAESEKAHLLAHFLPDLFRFPPSLLGEYIDALQHDSPQQRAFNHLARLMNALKEGDTPVWKPWKTGKERRDILLRQWPNFTAELWYTVIQLMCCPEPDKEEWPEQRATMLALVRCLQQVIHESINAYQKNAKLDHYLNFLFPKGSVPRDQESLALRKDWFSDWSVKLANLPTATASVANDWRVYFHKLYEHLGQRLKKVIEAELAFLYLEVRPFLQLEGVKQEQGIATVRLTARAEGERDLKDVTLIFDGATEGGLGPVGNAHRHEAHFTRYPGGHSTQSFQLRGTLAAGQRRLCIRAELISTRYRHETVWSFVIPEESKQTDRPTPARLFPTQYEAFIKAIQARKTGVMVIAFDDHWNRDDLLHRLQSQGGVLRIDPDQLLAEYGKGRKYSTRPLSAGLIEERITDAIGAGRIHGQKPVILTPIAGLLARFEAGEGSGALEKWCERLANRGRQNQSPAYWIMVNHRDFHRLQPGRYRGLRQLDFQGFFYAEIGAHRSREKELVRHFDELFRRAGLEDDGELRYSILERLGWDLRLLLDLPGWLAENRGIHKGDAWVNHFLRHHQDLLKKDLGYLDDWALIAVLLGALTQTKIEVARADKNLVAAEDFVSTTRQKRSQGKTLVSSGSYFDQRAIVAIESDRLPRRQITVQGVGSGTPVRVSRLRYIFDSLAEKKRDGVYQDLARRGYGVYVFEIFRTNETYRWIIRQLIQEIDDTEPEIPLYRQLMGGETSPLENLGLEQLDRMRHDQIELLIGGDHSKSKARALKDLARLWHGDKIDGGEVRRCFEHFFEPQRYLEPPISRTPGLVILRLGQKAIPELVLFWCDHDTLPSSIILTEQQKVPETKDKPQLPETTDKTQLPETTDKPRAPVLILTGPGALGADEEDPRFAILRPKHYLRALEADNPEHELERQARLQLDILQRSPYQTTNALLPGSPLFVGREKELSYIEGRIRQASILIVGSRRVGKTSLLNQVYARARKQGDLQAFYLDLQGVKTARGFLEALAISLRDQGYRALVGLDLRELVGHFHKQGRLVLFLLNEIDAIASNDEGFIELWRGLNDAGLARFVMVGYSTIKHLGSPEKPLFHFTEGTAYDKKAIPLSQLSRRSARQLIDLLEGADLRFRWKDDREKEEACDLLLEYSYCIPWVLQSYCQAIVEKMAENKSDLLTLGLVTELVRGETSITWRYIDNIDYGELTGATESLDRNIARSGIMLILYALVRARYLLGGHDAPIEDPRLAERNCLKDPLAFTAEEAHAIMQDTMGQILYRAEFEPIRNWFEKLDLRHVLQLLTLTLVVEPDPEQSDRYGFLLHILPKELKRKYGKEDPNLDGEILDTAVRLLGYFQTRGDHTT